MSFRTKREIPTVISLPDSNYNLFTFVANKIHIIYKHIVQENKPLSKLQVILMSVAAGASVANIYYNQPILKNIALSLNVNESMAGSISMLSQIGYGLGLFFIIPLGDKINKKNLILSLLSFLVLVLFLMAVATNIHEVWILSILIGILSVSVQVILPMAASLDMVNRGKTVGTIFSGILIGILAARVFSGFIAEWLGWHYVYAISAVLILVITLLLRIYLPDVRNEFKGHYFQLLQSVLLQIKRFPLLREASLTGALLFGVFCSFWTTLTFHLSGAPFYFHADTIGLFGFVAIAGALMAPVFGKLADKGNSKRSLILAVSMVLASLLLIKFIPNSVITLVIAVLILDVGIQAMQVTNVAMIYTLDETSHSRINTIYMTTYFIGGAMGTFVGLLCWKHGGWNWVTSQMLIWALLALGIVLNSTKKQN
jgi:predicted MFS family arabinose efflux permease